MSPANDGRPTGCRPVAEPVGPPRPRIGFVTCVQVGRSVLEALLDMGATVDVLVTLPADRARSKAGRVHLGDLASRHGIDLITVSHVDDAVDALRAADLDWLFVIGWSQIAGPGVLAVARHGAVGMHPTLLPVGRGNAAVPWAIVKGLPETGVTAFVLEDGVDTGPVLGHEVIPVESRETATTLYAKVDDAHVRLIRSLWPALRAGTLESHPQDEARATTWPRRTPADGLFDPAVDTVDRVDRLVRATTRPYPGAFYVDDHGRAVTVWAGEPGRRPGGVVLRCADGDYTVLEHESRR